MMNVNNSNAALKLKIGTLLDNYKTKAIYYCLHEPGPF
jgi:hypothetical protein